MHCSYDSVTDRITDGRTDATPRSHSLDRDVMALKSQAQDDVTE